MEAQFAIRYGYIIAITGSVKSGKSTFAYSIVSKEKYSKIILIFIFTPKMGRREITVEGSGEKIDQTNRLATRNGSTHDAIEFPEQEPEFILEYIKRVRTENPDKRITVIIEEAQFCSMKLVSVVKDLAEIYDCKVIVVGLDQKSTEEGFGPMPKILIEADVVYKMHAVCTRCGSVHATKSYLPLKLEKELAIGNILVDAEKFEPMCRHCTRAQKEKDAALAAQQP